MNSPSAFTSFRAQARSLLSRGMQALKGDPLAAITKMIAVADAAGIAATCGPEGLCAAVTASAFWAAWKWSGKQDMDVLERTMVTTFGGGLTLAVAIAGIGRTDMFITDWKDGIRQEAINRVGNGEAEVPITRTLMPISLRSWREPTRFSVDVKYMADDAPGIRATISENNGRPYNVLLMPKGSFTPVLTFAPDKKAKPGTLPASNPVPATPTAAHAVPVSNLALVR